jgi:hypothetical protein
MQFTKISKSTFLLKSQFCGPAPETFWHFTDKPLVHTKLPKQNPGHAIGSFAVASGGPAKFGQAGGVLSQEKGGGGARAHLRLNCGRGWGGGSSGRVARRRRPRRAAALPIPARRGALWRNRRVGRLEWGLEGDFGTLGGRWKRPQAGFQCSGAQGVRRPS